MFPKELVSTLISELNQRLNISVHTSGIENQRPVPAILVDGISIEPKNYHNSNHVGNEWQNGSIVSEKHRQYYDARIDLVVRAADETDAYFYLGQLQNELSLINIDPCKYLHQHAIDFTVGSSGQVRYQFNVPTETELSQSVEIESFYDTTHDDFDTLENVPKTYDFN